MEERMLEMSSESKVRIHGHIPRLQVVDPPWVSLGPKARSKDVVDGHRLKSCTAIYGTVGTRVERQARNGIAEVGVRRQIRQAI